MSKVFDGRKTLATIAHGIWSHWMDHLLNKVGQRLGPGHTILHDLDGDVLLHKNDVERWDKQVKSHYDHLTEKEQASDLEQADYMLKLLGMSADRLNLFLEISNERHIQDAEWENREDGDQRDFSDWDDAICEQLRKAEREKDGPGLRRRIVRVAALAVEALEFHDR